MLDILVLLGLAVGVFILGYILEIKRWLKLQVMQ